MFFLDILHSGRTILTKVILNHLPKPILCFVSIVINPTLLGHVDPDDAGYQFHYSLCTQVFPSKC